MSRLTNGEHLLLTIIMVAFVLWLLALPVRADLAPVDEPTVIASAGTPVPVTGTPQTSSTRSPAPTAIAEPPTVPNATPTPPDCGCSAETPEPPTSTPPPVSGPGWIDDPSHLLFLPHLEVKP